MICVRIKCCCSGRIPVDTAGWPHGFVLSEATLLKTRRLTLKAQSLHDFDRFFAMSKDPEVMRYIGDGNIFYWSRETALIKFKEQLAAAKNHSPGVMAVYRQSDASYLGWCAVSHSRFLGHMELGYRFSRDAWGCGYATEAAWALLTETYRSTDLDTILACAHPDNAASIRVLAKLGFRYTCSKYSRPIAMELPVFRMDRKIFGLLAGDDYLLDHPSCGRPENG